MPQFFGPEMLLRIPALLVAITFHEYAHAKTSHLLGDPTPRWSGRLTLNPLAHLDPVGLLMLWLFRFGWAKPVPVNPLYYKNKKLGLISVALAGPLANFVLAFMSLFILKLGLAKGYIESFLYVLFSYNLILSVFNLIPIPPLDGSKILMGILPGTNNEMFYKLEQFGPLILILLVYLNIIDVILHPLISIVYRILFVLTDLIV
ncbi:MAG: site-2 protease family protein [Thermovenabulum sp.]|uniref:site-2 protease family protein n=1 Tax=Thermovenabulum sp. TaxID=3100335 RepID=UPI003C7D1550